MPKVRIALFDLFYTWYKDYGARHGVLKNINIAPLLPGFFMWIGSYICSMQQAKDDLQVRWLKLRIMLKEQYGIKPEMDGILFLIGVQELGTGKQEYTKEQKQDLMHIAVCTILSQSGYYAVEGYDEEGWPHFKQLKALPEFEFMEQENFLKDHVLLYFEQFNKSIF